MLLTKNATRAKSLAAIRLAAKQLKSGDLFFLTYSGHGGQIPDVSGEEEDKKDETWCLYDGQLIDDDLYLELSGFASGVRVANHQAFYDRLQEGVASAAGKTGLPDPDSALANVAVSDRRTVVVKNFRPSVIVISGCQDNQTSMDGDHNGAFTEQLLQVWNHNAYKGNYAKFHAAIKARMPATQSPNFFTLGSSAAFVAQQPFSV